MKLSLDEHEQINALTDSVTWNTLLKIVSVLVKDADNRVLSYNLKDGPDGLMIAKARSEGANSLFLRITELKSKMKKQEQ